MPLFTLFSWESSVSQFPFDSTVTESSSWAYRKKEINVYNIKI